MRLAHGVGAVYELPIPLYLYLLAAAATVAVSFIIRATSSGTRPLPQARTLLGPGPTGVLIPILRWTVILLFAVTLISGIVYTETGISFTNLAFWVAFVVGVTILSSVIGGVWERTDPWASIEGFYRLEDAEVAERRLPWWTGPLLVFALFWFELVSGVGFDPFWIVMVLVAYSLFYFMARRALGESWGLVDPFSILFGFASRSAPLRVAPQGLLYVGPLRGLDEKRPMPLALYASVFVLMASTTFDNLSETVGWFDFKRATGLDALPDLLVETVALAVLALPFYLSFVATMAFARGSLGRDRPLGDLSRHFGWSLVPIGVAYVLAHNAPLVITGVPQLLRAASDPFVQGWNLFGTKELWMGFSASPKLVWFLEIALIVGGHILGVLAGHRIAVRLAPDHRSAVKSEYALTALMSVYTITTLWLLAQPLVA